MSEKEYNKMLVKLWDDISEEVERGNLTPREGIELHKDKLKLYQETYGRNEEAK